MRRCDDAFLLEAQNLAMVAAVTGYYCTELLRRRRHLATEEQDLQQLETEEDEDSSTLQVILEREIDETMIEEKMRWMGN